MCELQLLNYIVLFVDLYAECCLFAVDIPLGGVTVGGAYNKIVGNNRGEDIRPVACNNIGNLVVALNADDDVIGNVEVCVLTHCLNLADYLTYKALLNKLGSKRCVDRNGYSEIGYREETRFLNSFDKKIIGCQLNCADADVQRDVTVCVKLLLCL